MKPCQAVLYNFICLNNYVNYVQNLALYAYINNLWDNDNNLSLYN